MSPKIRVQPVHPSNRWSFQRTFIALSTLAMLLLAAFWGIGSPSAPADSGNSVQNWVGTWSTAPQLVEPRNNPPEPGLSDNTLRQIVRVSIGGERLRLRFSNEFSTSPVAMQAVHLATAAEASAIDPSTDRELLFAGKPQVTLMPGAVVTSDPLDFPLAPRSNVTITIYFGETSPDVTGHPGSRTTSYLLTGNHVSAPDFASAVETDHWYVINGIDVVAQEAAAIAILGNSITDGRGSGTNKQNRWPDELARRLHENAATQHVAVLNMGIGGNCVLRDCLGPAAVDRFARDVLVQSGVKWLIILEGINDIGGARGAEGSAAVANDLIAAYEQKIDQAHAEGILVYGATLLPFGGSFYDSPEHETARQTVNDWIRGSGRFDAVIDFDLALRDPAKPLQLVPEADTGDHLHPNETGYRLMAEAIDLHLFHRSADISPRQRISLNDDWRFFKYDSPEQADKLIYDVRPEATRRRDDGPADAKPTEAEDIAASQMVLKPWILPTGNNFMQDREKRHLRPAGNPGGDFPFVQNDFNDSAWERVKLPHDWAIDGPFFEGENAEVGGGMGRLPSHGVAWYRKKLDIPASDADKSIFLEVDGAMSYAIIWLNGHLVGGWPYGYNSWSVDLTPYIVPDGENQLAVRLDNPNFSARWYPGGGIYRNVWLTKTDPVHVGQWGAFVTTRDVSESSAVIDLEMTIDNDSKSKATVTAVTEIFALNADGHKTGAAVAVFEPLKATVAAGKSAQAKGSITLKNPRLWGPPPTQAPNLYMAVTTVLQKDKPIDQHETRFGIRALRFHPDSGIYVNGERIQIKGVNQHHDLGALGAAFNTRAAERQLEILREMGNNAIRTAHNPPAPELLELTDRMGFLVMDEIFDVWERRKTPLDFHLIFPDWHEQDVRAFVRRDRNCPSVIMWSFGNEVGEQYTGEEGAAIAQRLREIVKDEDPTRPTTSAMNWAKPDMPLPAALDLISLNYQGEGIRQGPEFEGTDRIRTAPQYPAFHEKFPDKVILSSETASAFSSRGVYLFPVTEKNSDIVRDGRGGDSNISQVSAYELNAVDFGSSAEKVFGSLARHPFVAGEFVWTGWDYLGEPTPYYNARSSYSGIIDLAGFKKDRFYLYQAHWRPELPMAHILPHWNWPERVGQITPVHVFTSGDEAELFLNGVSLGREQKVPFEYRLRWDEVKYQPGELKVVAYKNGKEWAEDSLKTTGEPAVLAASADRATIRADGDDLAFITVRVTDQDGLTVPRADNPITLEINGPGEIVATDNGDPTNLVPFPAHERAAFNGLALVIVRSQKGAPGLITVTATSPGLAEARVIVKSQW